MSSPPKGAERFRVAVTDRILIHLLDHVGRAEKPEVPREVTQQGMAEALAVRRSHVSLSLASLRERGLAEERTVRVVEETRRRKGYFLTAKGYEAAKRLAEDLGARTVRLRSANGPRDVAVRDVSASIGTKISLTDVLRAVDAEGVLDLSVLQGHKVLGPPPPPPPPEVPTATPAKTAARWDLPVLVTLLTAAGALTAVRVLFGLPWSLTATVRLLAATLPALLFAALARPLAPATRAEVAAALGVFLLALAAAIVAAPAVVGWTADYAGYFLLAGFASIYLATRIHHPPSLWPFAAVGAGGFLTSLTLVVLVLNWNFLSWMVRAGLLLWAGVGVFLIAVRFTGPRRADLLAALRAGIIAAVGGGMVAVGAWVFLRHAAIEGLVDIALGGILIAVAVVRPWIASWTKPSWVARLAVIGLLLAAVLVTAFAIPWP